jgi:hypothetical protein
LNSIRQVVLVLRSLNEQFCENRFEIQESVFDKKIFQSFLYYIRVDIREIATPFGRHVFNGSQFFEGIWYRVIQGTFKEHFCKSRFEIQQAVLDEMIFKNNLKIWPLWALKIPSKSKRSWSTDNQQTTNRPTHISKMHPNTKKVVFWLINMAKLKI